ncbi:phosphoribosylformylglycinamidine cyclo-ligase [Candidatus Vallotia lariciata]|uniref:phosphoribosylformylglycinamidine cyclo-ligase n=1 Tax=Candidatus Vallotia laricis TaxID=2018052 RepID=UPI001D030B2F|nr:phosphoribosylformylglycinamidine cyclo-ligase [Candidatus Vallotia lariciata]
MNQLKSDAGILLPDLSYRDAGVDIDAGDALINRITPFANKTIRDGVLAGIGGFSGLFKVPNKYREPVLVSSTDGVGTKLKLAFHLNRHDTIGQDLVAMSVNDILAQGAEPLFFLDYFACGTLDVEMASRVLYGISVGCELASCSLIGGETAEMPGMYQEGEYDLAGFAVGVVEKENIIDGRTIVAGDIILGLASSGIHSNGYSLVRTIIKRAQLDLQADFDGRALADTLMMPTRIYVQSIRKLIEQLPVKGIAHITGGGLVGNIPRVLPKELCVKLDRHSWPWPRLFTWLQKLGNISDEEMYRVFNCGIGIVVIIDAEHTQTATAVLSEDGEKVWTLGTVCQRKTGEAQTIIV